MEITPFSKDPKKGNSSGSKRYSTPVKDFKMKLLCINKRISDLHRQKKCVYKKSVKAKKMVHNQVNQIVRCFRARERNLCSDIDEVYFSQDATINDELSKLQSVYTHCQALLNHIEDFKEKSDVLKNIDIILSEISLIEKPDVKALEFVSDFEMMKVKASSYGYLEGDFVKKDDFAYVGEEKDNKLSDYNSKLFKNKEILNQNNCSASKNDSNVSSQKSSLFKTTECDDFQIIDLLDNMKCQDIEEDFVMDEDVNLNCTLQTEDKLNELESSRSESTFKIKEYNISKNSSGNSEANIDFNPEEEWKQILEMNKKIASWHGKTSTGTVSEPKKKEKSYDKNYKACRYFLLKDANNWLHNSKNVKLEKEASENTTNEMNSPSPAEIIQKSFEPYLDKYNIQKWLSNY